MKRLLALALLAGLLIGGLRMCRPDGDEFKTKIADSYVSYAPIVSADWDHPSPLKGVGATYTGPWYTPEQYRTPGAVSWYHNWGPTSYKVGGDAQFIPTAYGTGSTGPFAPSPYLLTYNEVTGPPADYVDAWIALAEAYPDRGVFLPSVHQDKLWWIDDFHAELESRGKAHLAYGISFHIYMNAPSGALIMLQQAGERADEWGLDLWVTEYGFDPCWPGGTAWAIQVMEQVAAECEAHGWHYAWFQQSYPLPQNWWHGCNTSLVDYDTGADTELGEAWRRIP